MITFKEIQQINRRNVAIVCHVYNENKKVGIIKKDNSGFYYEPKGTKFKGVSYATLTECKNSLLED